MLATRLVSIFVTIASIHQSWSSPVIAWIDPDDVMMYQLIGSFSKDREHRKHKAAVQNVKLQQILTGGAKTTDDMEFLTEIGLNEAELDNCGILCKSRRHYPQQLSKIFKGQQDDNSLKLNFTQVLNANSPKPYPMYEKNNPMFVFNVHLEYLANTFGKKRRNKDLTDYSTVQSATNRENDVNTFNIENNNDALDFVNKHKRQSDIAHTADYDFRNKISENEIGPDASDDSSDDFRYLYRYDNPDDVKDKDAYYLRLKRGFSVLTRWKPFSKLGHESWMRRPYFQAILRHGDDMYTAEAHASAMTRPYGTPLRWG